MPRGNLCLFPDPILRQKAASVASFDRALAVTLKKMYRLMKSQPSGIGIAAPQIGISKRIALVDVSARVAGARLLTLVNPEILELAEPRASREGCMSLPDYTANLVRYNRIRFKWQDAEGVWHEQVSAGIEAVCVQHEVDHLNGVLFLDRVASLKRDMIPRPRPH